MNAYLGAPLRVTLREKETDRPSCLKNGRLFLDRMVIMRVSQGYSVERDFLAFAPLPFLVPPPRAFFIFS
jgi:hypothetical protein